MTDASESLVLFAESISACLLSHPAIISIVAIAKIIFFMFVYRFSIPDNYFISGITGVN
jgi:hypothetical protein